MKFNDDILRILQLDGLDRVNPTKESVRNLTLKPQAYRPVNGTLPFILVWRFQVSRNGQVLLHFLAEDRYILAFSIDNVFPLDEARRMIEHSHFKLCRLWSNLVLDSNLDGTELPSMEADELLPMAKQIIHLAGELELFA